MANEILGLVDRTTGQEVADSDARYIIVPAGSVQGDLLYRSAVGWNRLPAGVANQMLKTIGAGGNPAWDSIQNVPPFNAANQGDVLYRGASSWSKLSPGSAGDFLQTQGVGADPLWAAGGGGGASAFTDLTDTAAVFVRDRMLASNPGFDTIEFIETPLSPSFVVGNKDRLSAAYRDKAINCSNRNYIHEAGVLDGVGWAVSDSKASSAVSSYCGTVFIRRGLYELDSTLILNRAGMSIVGEGVGQTILDFTNLSSIGTYLIEINAAPFCSIKNLTIRFPSGTPTNAAIRVAALSNFHMENVSFEIVGTTLPVGYPLIDVIGGTNIYFDKISVNSKAKVFNLYSSNNVHITRSDLTFTGVGRAIYADNCNGLYIHGNKITGIKTTSDLYGLIEIRSTAAHCKHIAIFNNELKGMERIILCIAHYQLADVFIFYNEIEHNDMAAALNNQVIDLSAPTLNDLVYAKILYNDIKCDSEIAAVNTTIINSDNYVVNPEISGNTIYMGNRRGKGIVARYHGLNVHHNYVSSVRTISPGVIGIETGTALAIIDVSVNNNHINLNSPEAVGILFQNFTETGSLCNNTVNLNSAFDPRGIWVYNCYNSVIEGNNVRALGAASAIAANGYLFTSCSDVSITGNHAKIGHSSAIGFNGTSFTRSTAIANSCDNSLGGTKETLGAIIKKTALEIVPVTVPATYQLNDW